MGFRVSGLEIFGKERMEKKMETAIRGRASGMKKK